MNDCVIMNAKGEAADAATSSPDVTRHDRFYD